MFKRYNNIEKEIILFLVSRLKLFKCIDYDLTLELISENKNLSVYEVQEIIKNYLISQNKITILNSSFCLTVNEKNN